MYFELTLYFFLAIGFSFFCSIAEAVLLSITPSYIANLQKNNHGSAKLLAELKSNIERPLAAILSLNTIAHTVGAAGVGASAASIWGDTSIGIASAAMTLAILVLSEIIPKTIGANYWRELSSIIARLTKYLILLLYPLVLLSEQLSKLLARKDNQQIVTRAEVSAIAQLGVEGGVIKGRESKILQNLFRFETLRVGDIMTPRTVITAFSQDSQVKEVIESDKNIPFSRLPVFKDDIDHVTGYVLKTDLLIELAANPSSTKTLVSFIRPILSVSDKDTLPTLLDTLMDKREHMVLVADPYGGTNGVVTMEDLMETLLGSEIVDEVDEIVDMRIFAKELWNKRRKRNKEKN